MSGLVKHVLAEIHLCGGVPFLASRLHRLALAKQAVGPGVPVVLAPGVKGEGFFLGHWRGAPGRRVVIFVV